MSREHEVLLAAEEPSLRVWWVDPGDMRTRMHQDAFPGEDISDRPEPSAVVPSPESNSNRGPPSPSSGGVGSCATVRSVPTP